MELLCPHCLKRVTVSDDKAGQVLNCPLCAGVFAAPSLAPAPPRAPAPPPPPPPPPPSPIPFRVEPVVPVADKPAAPPPRVEPPAPTPSPPAPPRPAPPPGDYSGELSVRVRPDILVWVPPAALLVIFVLSFFDWHSWPPVGDLRGASVSLWGLAFGEHGSGVFLAYLLLTLFPTLPLAIACVIFEKRWVPTPPQLAALLPWKSVVTLFLVGLTFLLLCYDYQSGLFSTGLPVNPIALAEKVAIRVHFIALLALLLELWAQGQQSRNRPLPRFSVKW